MMINSISKELFVSFTYGVVPPLIMFEETSHTKFMFILSGVCPFDVGECLKKYYIPSN
jgi:hypothetical protein